MACPLTVTWAFAVGTILAYEFMLDGQVYPPQQGNTIEICIDDDQVHTLVVTAIHATGERAWSMNQGTLSELGPPTTPTVTPKATPTATPIATPTTTPTTTPTATPDICAVPPGIAADFDKDGIVGFTDYGILLGVFGTKNDGQGHVVP